MEKLRKRVRGEEGRERERGGGGGKRQTERQTDRGGGYRPREEGEGSENRGRNYRAKRRTRRNSFDEANVRMTAGNRKSSHENIGQTINSEIAVCYNSG